MRLNNTLQKTESESHACPYKTCPLSKCDKRIEKQCRFSSVLNGNVLNTSEIVELHIFGNAVNIMVRAISPTRFDVFTRNGGHCLFHENVFIGHARIQLNGYRSSSAEPFLRSNELNDVEHNQERRRNSFINRRFT